MKNFFLKFRQTIKEKSPLLFRLVKAIVSLPGISVVYGRIRQKMIPAEERYDPTYPDAENQYFEKYAALVLKKTKGRIIDVGCGYGYLTDRIAQLPQVSEVIAIDKINPEDFRFRDNAKIKYLQRDITRLSDSLGPVDMVVSTEFVEHIKESDFKNLLSWIKKTLRPGGVFFGSTPLNPTNQKKFSTSPFHIREYTIKDFTALLTEAGFNDIVTEAVGDFFAWEARI